MSFKMLISLVLLSLTPGCGYHESRSINDSPKETPPESRALTEAEEVQSEIQSGQADRIFRRIDSGMSLNFRVSKGKTLLMEAAIWRQVDIVKALLLRGADPLILDDDGKSVRDHAQGNADILRLLPTVVDLDTILRVFQLVEAGDYRKLKAELDQGLDSNLRNEAGDTLLIHAVRLGVRSVVATLVRYPGIQLSERDRNGKTALMIARELGNAQIEKELLARGATE
ncbi:MAG: ankyrin repeat domain-containing protein [Bdellovibrionales bacterium]|nr:ankyrin repeat domain-containing protein [Bdellovibrionales bacterium]